MKDFNFEVWRMQAQSDVRGLVATLSDPNPVTRRIAATALRSLALTTAIPGVQDALMRETDPEVREVLVTTLELLFAQNNTENNKEPSAENRNVVRLIARLSGNHTEQAVRAAQELGDSREKLTVEALLLTFNNRKLAPRVRLAAAEALLKLQSATMEISLLAALNSEKWMVRRNATGVLGQLNADWAVEPMLKLLRDPIEGVRRVAQAALERIGTPEALAAIKLQLSDNDIALSVKPPTGTVISEALMNPAAPQLADKPAAPVLASAPEQKPPAAPVTQNPTLPISEAVPPVKPPDVSPAPDKSPAFNWSTMLTEPLLDEEDTKPIRPVPDDVS